MANAWGSWSHRTHLQEAQSGAFSFLLSGSPGSWDGTTSHHMPAPICVAYSHFTVVFSVQTKQSKWFSAKLVSRSSLETPSQILPGVYVSGYSNFCEGAGEMA